MSSEGRRRPQPRRKKKPVRPVEQQLSEIGKLIRKIVPLSVNGYPTEKIVGTESLKKTENANLVQQHIAKLVEKDAEDLHLSLEVTTPSDFPFELEKLKFNLTISAEYPRIPCSILVLNSEIPRGNAVNIERGFRYIAQKAAGKAPALEEFAEVEVQGKGLYAQIQALSKYLDVFLRQSKRTVKLVLFRSRPATPSQAEPLASEQPKQVTQSQAPKPVSQNRPAIPAAVSVSEATRAERLQQIQELTTKLGDSVKLFNKSAAQLRFKVKLPVSGSLPKLYTFDNYLDVFVTVRNNYPESRAEVAVPSTFTSNLIVAKRASIKDEDMTTLSKEAKAFENNFKENAAKIEAATLVALVNYVANTADILGLPLADYDERVQTLAATRG